MTDVKSCNAAVANLADALATLTTKQQVFKIRNRKVKPLIYLASPYTHEKKSEMAKRFIDISRIAAKLTIKGHYIISPISMNHPWKEYGDDDIGYSWEFWKEFDTRLIEACNELWVALMPGWATSVGVQAEIVIARQLWLPIRYVDADTCEIYNELPKEQ